MHALSTRLLVCGYNEVTVTDQGGGKARPRFYLTRSVSMQLSIPSVARFLGFQMALLMRGDALEMLSRLVQSHGDIATVKAGSQQLVLLSHPDLARVLLVTEQRSFVKGEALQRARSVLGNGLLTSEGDVHLRQRRLVQPAFHRERIAAYAETMSQYSEQAALRWHAGERDMAREMAQLTLAIAGKTLFDAEVGDDAQAVGHALDELMGAFGLLMLPFSSQLERLPIPPMRRIRRARATIDNVIARLIAERRAEGARGDLLSTLIFAQDSEQGGEQMDDQQLRDEAITIFLAGHETTANALSWAWYLLARNPEAEARLHAEVDTLLGDRLPSADDFPHLTYTRAIVAETLRLYPPVWIFGRRAIAPVTIGDQLIPIGTTVMISPWVLHHDPRFFPDPERFLPERWLSEEMAQRPPTAYLPFGGGVRMCIGERFAWMEGVLILATLARRWSFRLRDGQVVVPRPAMTLRPRGGMPMLFTRREAPSSEA